MASEDIRIPWEKLVVVDQENSRTSVTYRSLDIQKKNKDLGHFENFIPRTLAIAAALYCILSIYRHKLIIATVI